MTKEEIKNTIEDILNKLTIDFERVEYIENGPYNTFLIHSNDAGILIGSRGENLEALSFLLRRMVENKQNEDEERDVFIVDVNNYQTKKLQELIENAQVSAHRAKLFKQSVELSPMTSYERMIVHSVFTDDPEISTESYGDGKFRRVVLKFTEGGGVQEANTQQTSF